MITKDIIAKINGGELDATFADLYGKEKISAARARYTTAVEEFEKIYGADRDAYLFSVSGRSEPVLFSTSIVAGAFSLILYVAERSASVCVLVIVTAKSSAILL